MKSLIKTLLIKKVDSLAKHILCYFVINFIIPIDVISDPHYPGINLLNVFHKQMSLFVMFLFVVSILMSILIAVQKGT
jgi:hypothetical protein